MKCRNPPIVFTRIRSHFRWQILPVARNEWRCVTSPTVPHKIFVCNLLLLVAVFALRPVYTGRMYGCQKCTRIYGPYIRPVAYIRALGTHYPYIRAVQPKSIANNAFLYEPYTRVTGTHHPYIRPVHTARMYGPYVRVSKMHPYIRAVNTARIYGCSVHTTRIELLFCTGRIYGPYIRAVYTGAGTHYP